MSFPTSRLQELFVYLRYLVFRKHPNDLKEELDFHLHQSIQANIYLGMAAEQARRQAMVDFGGLEQARESTHQQRPGWFLETLSQDIRYALRGFRRSPIFTLTIVITLAIAVGATTAIFSLVDPILFRSLPYAHADRLVSIGLVHSLEKQEFMVGSFFYEWRDNQKPFTAMASQSTGPHACVLTEANPQQLNCMNAQAALLPLLGIAPILGRNFSPEEDRPNGPSVAMFSYAFWKTHYGLDPTILNKLVNIDGAPVRVIGVLPQQFEMPTLQAADVIMPIALAGARDQHGMNGGIGQPMRVFARLKPGMSVAQARAEMDPLFQHTAKVLIPAQLRNDFHLSIRSLRDRQTDDVQLAAWVLLSAVFAVLLIACANVASLMMARGAARERELAVRSVLGASQMRLVRQTLTEAFLLSIFGAVTGLAVGDVLLRLFIYLAPASIPFLDRVQLDLRITCFTVILSLLSGAFFGIFPALQKPRAVALAARAANSNRHAFMRRAMVVSQITVSMVLLTGATLLLRSFQKMQTQSLGIESHGVMTARLSVAGVPSTPIPGIVSHKGQQQMQIFLQAEEAVRRTPGVSAVGWSDSFPPGGGWQDSRRLSDFRVSPNPSADNASTSAGSATVSYRGVTPGYFRALDIPIIRGRNFKEEERTSSQQFMVLSRLLASRLFPDEDAIGKRIDMGSDGSYFTVVGIAENVRNGGLSDQDQPEAYWLRRNIAADWGVPVPVMVFDTVLAPAAITPWLQAQVARINPTVPVAVETLDQRVNKLADRPRFETALLTFFALTGLVMAVLGLYGVTSYIATQRTQEIGIRMALGADRARILRLVAKDGLRLLIIGGVMGICSSLALTRLLQSLLFNVGPRDPATFLFVAVLLSLSALLATLIPATKATRVDPVVALRYE